MGVRKLHSGQCCRILGYSVSLSLVTSSGFEAIETIRKLEAESKLLFFLTKMDSFEFWLRRMENKLDRNTNRPKTREEACDLLEITKDLKEECESRELPKELLDEDEELDLDEEDEARAMDLLSRYNKILNTLTDNCMKAENLIVCWTKLDEDTKELTAALSSGGQGKLSMDELEHSLSQIKEMLKERSSIIENLTPPIANNY